MSVFRHHTANPTLLSPSWPWIPPPPAIRLRAVARLWTETRLRITRWPGHPQPLPWVCECLVWYVRLSSGRPRMWSRCSGVEMSRSEGPRGHPMNRNKTPILCCEVWGHKFIFNKKVVVIFPLLPLSVNQLFMYDEIWGRGADFMRLPDAVFIRMYIQRQFQSRKIQRIGQNGKQCFAVATPDKGKP